MDHLVDYLLVTVTLALAAVPYVVYRRHRQHVRLFVGLTWACCAPHWNPSRVCLFLFVNPLTWLTVCFASAATSLVLLVGDGPTWAYCVAMAAVFGSIEATLVTVDVVTATMRRLKDRIDDPFKDA